MRREILLHMLQTPDLAGCALDGRYELHELIGEGAFGRVYRGLDRRLARPVAVKVIKPWWAEDEAWVERFQREAQLLARVSDPGIVQIFDIGHAEEGPYYVAELVAGESLAERLRRGPLPVADAMTVAEALCLALASAHAQGVVHCDVKPANILLAADGRVKVGDFGVARLAEGSSQASSTTVAGTPRYMSPEQGRGRPTTSATDVYSAGVVLYEMLAGSPPFARGSAVELGLHHIQDPPPPLPDQIGPALREVVKRALAKNPGARYRDGCEMAAALRAAASLEAQAARSSAAHADAAAEPVIAARPNGAESAISDSATTITVARPEPATLALAAMMAEATALPMDAPRDVPAPPPSSPPARRGGAARIYRRRRIAVAALILALAGGALAAFALGGAARTRVPELRGLPRGGVEARARRLHLRPTYSTRYSAATAGVAIAQDPPPGKQVAEESTVRVVLSAGPPPVRVPPVAGQTAVSAESRLAGRGLRYDVTFVVAPGSVANDVVGQSPGPTSTVPRGSTVALSVAEAPRWRPLTTFSGTDDGSSVPFRIRGGQWRVSYSMSYRESCLLVVVCLGPSATAHNVQTGAGAGGFDLGEGSTQTHIFDSGPGLFRLAIAGGQDSARWSMTVEDYY
jgi:eukaryotic-like serine/threonine-protein kinase